jgi:hypothetical protein
MNAVMGAILENLKRVNIVFDTTNKYFVKDTGQTGKGKELTVKEFIESFLPFSYNIQKGKIYDIQNESREIDCVILAPNHPRLYTPTRTIILSEGVYAAIEVKPDIKVLTKKSEFYRALMQIKSVKELKREIPFHKKLGDIPSDMHLIPCIIFSKTSQDSSLTVKFMKECVENNFVLPCELPDMIISLEKGIIFHTMHIERTLFANWDEENHSSNYGEKYITLNGPNEVVLCLFLWLLFSVVVPEPMISDFILINYLKHGPEKEHTLSYSIITP